MYAVVLEPDENGTLLVICPDLPEVTTWGEDEGDALRRAAGAIEEALAARIARHEEVPMPSPVPMRVGSTRRRKLNIPNAARATVVSRIPVLSPLTVAKVELYQAAYKVQMSKAELGRRLGWHAPQVDRLFDLNHHSRIEQIDQALRVLGKRIEIRIQDAA